MKKTLNKYYLLFFIIIIFIFIFCITNIKKIEKFTQNRNYFSIKGLDYLNDSISYFKGPFEECPIECDKTPKCKGFILDLDNQKNCTLKSSFEKPRQDYNKTTYYYGPTPLLPGSPGNLV